MSFNGFAVLFEKNCVTVLQMAKVLRTITVIDNRIARLQAIMKRLRAERRLAVLRGRHREMVSASHIQPPYSQERPQT